jgi:hypothetical protein
MRTVLSESATLRSGAGVRYMERAPKRNTEPTEVFPIRRSLPRAALVLGQGIFEQISPGMRVSVKGGSVAKDRGLVFGEEVEPFAREGG